MRLTAAKEEAPPQEKGGKRVSASHFYKLQAEADKWSKCWPKEMPDESGYAAPRLPADERELRDTLRQLVGVEQLATWFSCFQGEWGYEDLYRAVLGKL